MGTVQEKVARYRQPVPARRLQPLSQGLSALPAPLTQGSQAPPGGTKDEGQAPQREPRGWDPVLPLPPRPGSKKGGVRRRRP